MTLHRATPRKHVEWSLLIDALVEIRHHGKAIRTGFVEDAMPDSSALWLAADATHPRQMFEAAQGHQVWVTPQELSGGLNYRMTATQIFGKSSGSGPRTGSVNHQPHQPAGATIRARPQKLSY